MHSDEDIEKGKKKMTKGKRNKSKKGRIEDSNRNDAQEKVIKFEFFFRCFGNFN